MEKIKPLLPQTLHRLNLASDRSLILPPPQNFISNNNYQSIDLQWNAVSGAGTSSPVLDPSSPINPYQVYHSLNNSSFSIIGTSPSNTYTHSALECGTQHYYQIKAINEFSDNVHSLTSSLCAITPIPALASVSATAISPLQINLNWSKNGCNSSFNFLIFQSTSNSFGTVNGIRNCPEYNGSASCDLAPSLSYCSGSACNLSVTGLNPSTTYYFRIVAATPIIGSNATTTTASSTEYTPTASPTLSLNSLNHETAQIGLSWSSILGVRYYRIHYSRVEPAAYLGYVQTTGTSNTFSLTKGYNYSFYVTTHFSGSGYVGTSNTITQYLLAPPESLSVSALGNFALLSWNSPGTSSRVLAQRKGRSFARTMYHTGFYVYRDGGPHCFDQLCPRHFLFGPHPQPSDKPQLLFKNH